MPDASYENDFFQWTQDQARRLREAGGVATNMGLDWENVAEEIESLGRSDRREIASRLDTIIQHLLKLRHSTADLPRAGWVNTVMRERDAVRGLLDESPSLLRHLPDLARQKMLIARRTAAIDIEAYGEHAAAGLIRLDSAADLIERVLDDDFIPHPPSSPTSASA